MSRSLFRFALVALLPGCSLFMHSSIGSAQTDSGRAYPMNVNDRINALEGVGKGYGYDDGGRSIGAAGAYPMNTMDRINAIRRSDPPQNRLRSPSAATSKTSVATPSIQTGPDGWRYVLDNNRWWYYGSDSRWLYWIDGRWKSFAAPAASSAAKNDVR